MKLGVTRG